MVKVDGFDWDAGNQFKSEAKHGLSKEAIEAFFHGTVWVSPDPLHSTDREERFLAIGRGGGGRRPMIVTFTFRMLGGKKLIRPISARFMHAKEARRYEQAFAEDEE